CPTPAGRASGWPGHRPPARQEGLGPLAGASGRPAIVAAFGAHHAWLVPLRRPSFRRRSALCIREEQLLAVDLVVGDRLLACRRYHPVGELLRQRTLHVRVFGRVHHHHTVLVEQPLVALDEDREITAVLERQ